MSDTKFLMDLLGTHSPSGWEAPGVEFWKNHVGPYSDRVETDAYGNAWAVLDGTDPDAPSVMLAAHADEIGFIVRHIDDNGFLSIAPIGGSDRTIARARKLRIFGDKGEVPGVIGNTAVHLREKDKDKVPEWTDLYVDVGASNREEAEALGVRVGCPMVFVDGAEELSGGRLVGRAIDNRISGYLIAEVLKRISAGKRPPGTTFAVNAVQEEIGGNGARMVAHRLRPSVALVFDVTHATDTPGIDHKKHGSVKLGKGPTVAHGAANHPAVVRRLLDVALEKNIPLQHEAISRTTSTDADVVFISREGIPCALVSIPMRYMHSPTEIVDLADVHSAIDLVTEFLHSPQPLAR